MSSNRLIYDKCAYAKEIKESTKPLEYYLYPGKYLLQSRCPIGDFSNELDFASRADTENELFGLNRRNSLCPELKYNPLLKFKYVPLSPARICENIYYITPNNLEKPNNAMIDCGNINSK